MTQFNPNEPVFPALTAQEALNEALAHLMDRATEFPSPQGEYPLDEEIDRLAPSLKGLVTKEIREQQLTPCNHAFGQLADLAHDIVAGLPQEETQALIDSMKAP